MYPPEKYNTLIVIDDIVSPIKKNINRKIYKRNIENI